MITVFRVCLIKILGWKVCLSIEMPISIRFIVISTRYLIFIWGIFGFVCVGRDSFIVAMSRNVGTWRYLITTTLTWQQIKDYTYDRLYFHELVVINDWRRIRCTKSVSEIPKKNYLVVSLIIYFWCLHLFKQSRTLDLETKS